MGSLLALEALDETAPIRMYINSPGGTPYSIIGVADAMQAVKPPIQTVALGACYSYSSLLLVREGGVLGRWLSVHSPQTTTQVCTLGVDVAGDGGPPFGGLCVGGGRGRQCAHVSATHLQELPGLCLRTSIL